MRIRGNKLRNVYMGPNSVAGIPTRGKVNEDWEILSNVFATAYDSMNNRMLTRVPGQFEDRTIPEIRSRFLIIKYLCKKNCPGKMRTISKLESMSIAHAKGKLSGKEFLRELRKICNENGLSHNLLNEIEARVNAAEMQLGFMGVPKKGKMKSMPEIKMPRIMMPANILGKTKVPRIKIPAVNIPRHLLFNPMLQGVKKGAKLPQVKTPPMRALYPVLFNPMLKGLKVNPKMPKVMLPTVGIPKLRLPTPNQRKRIAFGALDLFMPKKMPQRRRK